MTIKTNNGNLSICIPVNLYVTLSVGVFQWLSRGFFSSDIQGTELDMARSSEKCETCGAPLPITTKARYRDIRGRAPQQLLPGSERRQVLMSSVADQNDCVWIRMSLCVGLCLHVYVCVQVQPMRMGDSGPSPAPYSLPKSQNETTFETWTNAHSLKAGLSDCMPSPIPLIPQLGKNQP